MQHSSLGAAEMVRASLQIAGEICVYSNSEITVLELELKDES
jgi:ATP-dependent protease HslVU (ClpYQ) peptidase subunit